MAPIRGCASKLIAKTRFEIHFQFSASKHIITNYWNQTLFFGNGEFLFVNDCGGIHWRAQFIIREIWKISLRIQITFHKFHLFHPLYNQVWLDLLQYLLRLDLLYLVKFRCVLAELGWLFLVILVWIWAGFN